MWSARTAVPTCAASMTQEMRMELVEIMSRLTSASASARNILAATPGCVFIPAPTSDTFATDSSTV